MSSGCYLSPYGDDYKGNSSVRGCLPWSHPNVTSEGYNGLQYWELEGLEPGSTVTHNYCRNPSGLQYRPWCFVQNHGMIEANDSCIVERPYSPVFTCHNGKSAILVSNTEYVCVRLVSLGLPRGSHLGEPLTRATRTITHRSRSDVMHLGPAPK